MASEKEPKNPTKRNLDSWARHFDMAVETILRQTNQWRQNKKRNYKNVPVPVLACPTTSSPFKQAGNESAWMGVISVYPNPSVTALTISSLIPSSQNLVTHWPSCDSLMTVSDSIVTMDAVRLEDDTCGDAQPFSCASFHGYCNVSRNRVWLQQCELHRVMPKTNEFTD